MPQVDVQWPSENEDFDATTDISTSKAAVKSKPSITKIPDSKPEEPAAEPEEQAVEEPVNDAEPADEAPAQDEAPEETPPEEPAAAEVAPSDAAADQPDPDPVVEAEAANLASNVDNQAAAVSELPAAKNRRQMPKFGMPSLRLVCEAVLVLAVVGLGLWSWSLYSDRKDLQKQVASLNSNPQSVVQKQTQQLITKVGSLMQLPSGETPTVAEVSDAAQAKQQSSFFNKAQNGDRVLMYVKAGEAILYRPSTNKIILVAPLVFTNTSSSTSTTGTAGTTSTTSSTTKK